MPIERYASKSRTLHLLLEQMDEASPSGCAHPSVRDLAWLLFAPNTLNSNDAAVKPYLWPDDWVEPYRAVWQNRLLELSRDPSVLLAAIEPLPRRLGVYAEHLLFWWMSTCPDIEVLLRHAAVHEGKRTLGDFDLLLATPADGVIHLELTVKYFVAINGGKTMNDWVGTSFDDSLGIKWRRVVEHQLQLSKHPAAQALLPRPIDQHWCWFKAWMFDPMDGSVIRTPFFNSDHPRGIWGTAAELCQRWGDQSPCFSLRIIQRLAPARLAAGQTPIRLFELLQDWQQDPTPLILAKLAPHPKGGWVETERAYLVPDDWLSKGVCP